MKKPTVQQIGAYQHLFEYFNGKLFGNKLPEVILNFSRKNRSHGFFAPDRWNDENDEKKLLHEISLNPETMIRTPKEYLSTFVHEMAHLWQEAFGSPSRSGYHNLEWANKMKEIGLQPVSLDKPGKEYGQRVTHEIIPGGPYEKSFIEMPDEFLFPYRNVEAAWHQYKPQGPEGAEDDDVEVIGNIVVNITKIDEKRENRSGAKFCYSCPDCANKIWGKHGLNVLCEDCNEKYLLIG